MFSFLIIANIVFIVLFFIKSDVYKIAKFSFSSFSTDNYIILSKFVNGGGYSTFKSSFGLDRLFQKRLTLSPNSYEVEIKDPFFGNKLIEKWTLTDQGWMSTFDDKLMFNGLSTDEILEFHFDDGKEYSSKLAEEYYNSIPTKTTKSIRCGCYTWRNYPNDPTRWNCFFNGELKKTKICKTSKRASVYPTHFHRDSKYHYTACVRSKDSFCQYSVGNKGWYECLEDVLKQHEAKSQDPIQSIEFYYKTSREFNWGLDPQGYAPKNWQLFVRCAGSSINVGAPSMSLVSIFNSGKTTEEILASS